VASGEREKHREQFLQETFDALNHFETTGLRLTEEEAHAWFAKLEAGEDAPMPECHV
jgi:hypothetical protein